MPAGLRPRPPRCATLDALLALALAGAGCSFDLALPPQSDLAFEDAFPTAAPYQILDLAVSGGAKPYSCSFASQALSGAATPPTALAGGCRYTAGPTGPAVDEVQVRDASGATRIARISVGPVLGVVPRSEFVAPGGRASFVPSGGAPPYFLEIVTAGAPGSVDGTDYVAAPSGGCTGSVSSPVTLALRLRDSTAAPPIPLAVSVGRGLDLFPAVGTGAVAPFEQIAFVASGGQPPYDFSMATPIPSGGPGIDAGRGTYQAGPGGDVVDRVRVTDANGEERCFDVPVGPSLAVAFSTDDPRPGQPVRIEASGGRPPYAFSFAPKGNRSRGTLDPVTGIYVPGQNALATDLLLVEDATSAPPVGPIALQVGPQQVATDAAANGCWAADVNGDGRADLVSSDLLTEQGITVAVSRPGALPEVTRYTLGSALRPEVADLDGDGDADVAYLTGGELRTLLGQRDGRLADGPSVMVSSTSVLSSHLAVARGTSTLFFTTTSAGCPVAGAGLARTSIDPTTGILTPPACVAQVSSPIRALAAGDWNGDGAVDVAYATLAQPTSILYRLGGGANPWAVELAVPLPGPWRVENLGATAGRQLLEVRPSGAARSDLVAIVMDAPRNPGPFRTGLAALTGTATGLTLRQVGLFQFDATFNLLGLSVVGQEAGQVPRVGAWNGTDGGSALIDWPFAANPPVPSTVFPPRRFRVGCVAGGDQDADGVEDMALLPRDRGGRGDQLRGEGDGGWARRPLFAVSAAPVASGDVDGDGLPDVIGATEGASFEVLFPVDGQVAVGPETPVSGQFLAARAADWDGDGAPDVIARVGTSEMLFYRGRATRDGRFEPGLPIDARDPTGAPFDTNFVVLELADLGGAAPGPDLHTIVRFGSQLFYAAIVLDDAGHATVGVAPPIPVYEDVTGDLDGDGVDDFVALDPSGNVHLSLVKPGDPRTGGWPFRPWQLVQAPGAGIGYDLAGTMPAPGASPPRRRAVVVRDDAIVLVEAPGGVPSFTTIPIPQPPPFDPSSGFLTALADVDGDGATDLVVWDQGGNTLLFYPGTAGGRFAATPAPGLTLPLKTPFTWWAFLAGGSGPPDLFLQLASGGWIVMGNDGAGHFR
jgi:hypothetical protein